MNLHLILHNILYAADLLLVLVLTLLIITKAEKGMSKIMLIVTWICVVIFLLSHMVGVSVSDGELSRNIFMFNLVDIFLPLVSAHAVFALLDKKKENMKFLMTFYVIAVSLTVFFIIKPRDFLLTSIPKLYFPSYYVAGPYYWVMILFFFVVTAYFLVWMARIYKVSNGMQKNRIKYFFMAFLFGYSVGSLDFLLIYNVPVDPMWGFLFVPLSVIPFTYAALKYEIMNIRIVAKKAFVYGIITTFIAVLLVGLNYVNVVLQENYSEFPGWSATLILAVIFGGAVYYIWHKIQEADLLKYEFINVVTHKFRTPLTSIKWTTENLKETGPVSVLNEVTQIQQANEHLVELTNVLVNLSGSEDKSYEYSFSEVDIGQMINDCVKDEQAKAVMKRINISYKSLPPVFVMGDEQKLRFVFQTLLNNALSYTPDNGKIIVNTENIRQPFSQDRMAISISDTGIGIPNEEIKYIFTKFYRATNGRKIDTEGMGIGLYLSKHIVERHKGKMTVSSQGLGMGTTFTVILPIVG